MTILFAGEDRSEIIEAQEIYKTEVVEPLFEKAQAGKLLLSWLPSFNPSKKALSNLNQYSSTVSKNSLPKGSGLISQR